MGDPIVTRNRHDVRQKVIGWIALSLIIIGALNWGLIGFFNYNLIGMLLTPMGARVLYSIVGIAGLWAFSFLRRRFFSDYDRSDYGRSDYDRSNNDRFNNEKK